MLERVREQGTTEKLSARIERMLAELEAAAAKGYQMLYPRRSVSQI